MVAPGSRTQDRDQASPGMQLGPGRRGRHRFGPYFLSAPQSGGTGEVFNWHIIDGLQTAAPIILSGGLGIDNIISGIDTVSPSAVDINSGVEKMPGVKDEKKMKLLFSIIKNIEGTINPFTIPVFQGGRS